MTETLDATVRLEVPVAISAAAIAQAPALLVTVGLGSCVAIAVHAPRQRAGALAHVLLPEVQRATDRAQPARCAETAVAHLLGLLRQAGADGPYEARLAGGASMFEEMLPAGTPSLGDRNVRAAREACARAGVPIVGEDTGGRHGRSVWFDVADGGLLVRSVAHRDRTL